jgi:hypothetical protein
MDSRVFKKTMEELIDVLVDSQDQFYQVAIPADAANGTFEKTIFTAPFNSVVKDVKVIPDGDIGQATNFMTLDVQSKGSDGTGTTSIGSRAVNSTNTIEGFVGVDLVSTDAEITEGQSLSLKKTVTGTGQAFPGGLVIVRYEKT